MFCYLLTIKQQKKLSYKKDKKQKGQKNVDEECFVLGSSLSFFWHPRKLGRTVGKMTPLALFAAASPAPLYLTPGAPIDQRVDDLISKMTLEEKVFF